MLHGNNLGILVGNLTHDPDVLPTKRGDRLKLSFRVAVDRPAHRPPKNGRGRKADFFTVVRWGDYDEIIQLAAPLQKGTRVYTSGWWQSRDLETGSVATEMVADAIVPLEHLKPPMEEEGVEQWLPTSQSR
jgi:single-stranded DNA-binding protein